MKRIYSLAVITALGLGFSGCADNDMITTDDVIKIGQKSYTVTGFIHKRNNVYKTITEFCSKQNKFVKVQRERKISDPKTIAGGGWVYGVFAVDFKCLNENNDDKNYETSKDVTIESNVKVEKK